MPKKKFKYMFDVVQAIIFPVALVLVSMLFVAQGWVDPEDVEIVWQVIIIAVVASLISIIGAAWYVERQ